MQGIYVIMVCIFTAMLGLGIISPIMPLYASSLGATFAEIGLLSSAWSISRLLFTPFIGRVSDTTSRKKIIAAGLFMYAVVSVLYSVAWDFVSLVGMRFLHGLGSALATPVAMAYAAEITPRGKEGRYMGMMNLAMFGGMGCGPLVGGYLTDMFSLHMPFYLMGGLTAFSLLLTLVFLPDDRSDRLISRRLRPSYTNILSNRALAAVFIYRGINAIGYGTMFGFLSIFISGSPEQGALGLPLSVAGLILSLGQLTSAFLQRPFGDLADRYSKVRLIILGAAISAIGYLILPSTTEGLGVGAANMLFSLGGALSMPAITAIVAMEGKELGIGTTMSVLETANSAGMIVGPLISGIIIDLYGLRLIFYAGTIIILAGTLAFYFIIRKVLVRVESSIT